MCCGKGQAGWRSKSEWVFGRLVRSSACQSVSYSLCLSLLDSDGEWDFNWCDGAWLRKYFDHSYMEEHVRINHFHNNYEVSRVQLEKPWGNELWPCKHKAAVTSSLDYKSMRLCFVLFFSPFSSLGKTSQWKTSNDCGKTWKGMQAVRRRLNVTFSRALSLYLVNITSLWRSSKEPPAAPGSWSPWVSLFFFSSRIQLQRFDVAVIWISSGN